MTFLYLFLEFCKNLRTHFFFRRERLKKYKTSDVFFYKGGTIYRVIDSEPVTTLDNHLN